MFMSSHRGLAVDVHLIGCLIIEEKSVKEAHLHGNNAKDNYADCVMHHPKCYLCMGHLKINH